MFWDHRSWNNLQCIVINHLCSKICRVPVALGPLLQYPSLLQSWLNNHVTLCVSSGTVLLKIEVFFHVIVLENNPKILSLEENNSFTKQRRQAKLVWCLLTVHWLSVLALAASVSSQSCVTAAFPTNASVWIHTEIQIIATREWSLVPGDSTPMSVIRAGWVWTGTNLQSCCIPLASGAAFLHWSWFSL